MDFVVGDVVVLRSGGPRMTVTWAGVTAGVSNATQCQWFAGEGAALNLMSGSFPADALDLRKGMLRAQEVVDDDQPIPGFSP